MVYTSNTGGKKKILILEDSPTQLKKLELILTQAGYAVVTATNGVEGINNAFAEAPDLIVSDVVMPELNGYQFCRMIKNDPLRQHIPVILLTNLNESKDRFWGIEAGANAYIIKENQEKDLIPKIESLLSMAAPAPAAAQGQGMPDHHKSRANYMLDKLILESTISSKTREIVKDNDDTTQLMTNFFGLLYKLVDYTMAQLLIRDKKYYYGAIDVQEGVSQHTVNTVNYRTSEQARMGISPQCQKVIIIHKENIVPDEDDSLAECKLQSEIIFPFLVEEELMVTIAVHNISRPYTSETENIIRTVSQELPPIIKYFLAVERGVRQRRWYASVLTSKITPVYDKIAQDTLQLAETLAGKVEEQHWQSLRQINNTLSESKQLLMKIISSLKLPKQPL